MEYQYAIFLIFLKMLIFFSFLLELQVFSYYYYLCLIFIILFFIFVSNHASEFQVEIAKQEKFLSFFLNQKNLKVFFFLKNKNVSLTLIIDY